MKRVSAALLVAAWAGLHGAAYPRAQGTPQYTFSTIAGTAPGAVDGTGGAARFYLPMGVVVDSSGNAFVPEWLNFTIRKITPAGVVSTFAGKAGEASVTDGTGTNARFQMPRAIAIDAADVLYVADQNAIRTITPGGVVSTLAGSSIGGSVDGTGSAARFSGPTGLDVDSAGNVFVADTSNSIIRKITPAGVVTTVAGLLFTPGTADGNGSTARFRVPYGVAIDSADNIFISDFQALTIRRMTQAFDVTTFAGTPFAFGSADGVGVAARFSEPRGLAIDGSDNLYVADSGNHTIRRITPGAVVTTLAGMATVAGNADGTGSVARFRGPGGIARTAGTDILVADTSNFTIRKVTSGGTVTTFAGRASPGSNDGFGSIARFHQPKDVASNADGEVYVADTANNTIRKISQSGTVSTFAGLAGAFGSVDAIGTAARFSSPVALDVDADGSVVVADGANATIRRITPGGVVTTIAGTAGMTGHVDGAGAAARFGNTRGLAIDSGGNIYVADIFAHTIRKIAPPNIVTTFAGSPNQSGSVDGQGGAARFLQPSDVAVDGGDNVWVADNGNHTIRRITPSGVVSTIAGLAGACGGNEGLGSVARFCNPQAITADAAGNAYVFNNNVIRKITPVGLTTLLAGKNGTTGVGSADGLASAVQFRGPVGLTIDANGVIFVADTDNNTIRRGDPPIGLVAVNRPTLVFAAIKGAASSTLQSVTPPQDVTVSFSGGGGGEWTASSTDSWLQVTNASGVGAAVFTVGIVNPGNVIGGSVSLNGTVTVAAPTSTNSPITLNVSLTVSPPGGGGLSTLPFGQMDAPVMNAANVQGAIGVSGWALDDLGIDSVRIYRNCLAPDEPAANCATGLIPESPATSLAYIGDAAFVPGARPDLEIVFPHRPRNYAAGWGYLMLTTMLPRTTGGFAPNGGQGPLTLYAIATDVEGNRRLLGRDWTSQALVPTPITMNNDAIAKPFGAIDTPTQGGTVSGVIGNFGWVLTPDSNFAADGTDIVMPLDGSTLVLFVDGLAVGNITYNQCRGTVGNPPPPGVFCNDDVASIFGNITPQPPLTPRASNPTRHRNLDAGRGPQGSFALNTLALANGLHSIAWSATDSAGRVEGIGSRNFIVLNGAATQADDATLAAIVDAPARNLGSAAAIDGRRLSRRTVGVRTGFDLYAPTRALARGPQGVGSATIAPMDRVELSFAGPVDGGYLVVNGNLRDLPVGSSLNRQTGVFAWVPPVGYLGTYRLTFLVDGERVIVDVTITSDDVKKSR